MAVTLDMTLKDAQVLAGLIRMAREQDNLTKSVKGTQKAYKDVEDQSKTLAREQKKTADEAQRFANETRKLVATPIERFRDRMRELGTAYKDRIIDQQTYNRAVAKAKHDLDSAADSGDKAFGSSATSKVMDYVAGLVGVGTVIKGLTMAWEEYRKVQDEALSTSREGDTANRRLAGIAESPADLQRLKSQTDKLAAKYGVSHDETVAAQFEAGWSRIGDAALEDAMKGSAIGGDPSSDAAFMGSIKKIYGGKVDPRVAYRIAVQAAKDSKLDMPDFTGRMPETLNPASVLGLGVEETSAIAAEISPAFGEETFARMNDLFGGMALKKEYQGKGLAGFESMMSLSDEELEEVIGKDRQKNFAFREIRDKFKQIQQTAERYRAVGAATGTAADSLETQRAIALSDPEISAQIELRRAEAQKRIAQEGAYGVDAAGRQAALEQVYAGAAEDELGMATGLRTIPARGAAAVGAAPTTIRGVGVGFEVGARAMYGDFEGARNAIAEGARREGEIQGVSAPAVEKLLTAILGELKTSKPKGAGPNPSGARR